MPPICDLHHARIEWERGETPFRYDTYSRTHRVRFGGGEQMPLTAAARFRGTPSLANPEELFAAALSSCHMLTFLANAAREGIVVNHYADDATATLSEDTTGRLAVTRVVLRPKVEFGASIAFDKIKQLHEQAHAQCFIALATACEVSVEPDTGA